MTRQNSTYVIVGKIGSTYGVRGFLKVHSFTEFGESILDYQPWYLADNHNEWHAYQVEEGRLHGNIVIAKFASIETPEEAKLLAGKKIAVLRSQLPVLKKDEYYWDDLIGLTVIDQRNHVLGKVIYLMETGANDVLVIKGDKEYAIPYLVPDVILKVDLKKQEIHVNWELL